MYTYEIEVSKQGIVQKVVQMTADNALAAIEFVEAQFKSRTVQFDENTLVTWTGFEFQARRMDFVLS